MSEAIILDPYSSMYPFDATIARYIQALRRKGYQHPGIQVEFAEVSAGLVTYQYVSRVSGSNFDLQFGRFQGHVVGRVENRAAVSLITFERQQLWVNDIEGVELYTYVGADWTVDRLRFANVPKSGLTTAVPWFVTYTPSERLPGSPFLHYYRIGERPKYLVRETHLSEPREDAPDYYEVATFYLSVNDWLEANVLQPLLASS